MSKIPIIIDTDVFGDPDDILAITYLLANQNKVEIKLIVTADEHKGMRASWLKRYLNESKVSIPVVAGKDLGHSRLFIFDEIETKNVDFNYLEAIKKNIDSKNKVTYVCMAPQSNLAHFISEYPESKSRINVIGMGAVLDMDLGRIEHNVKYDIKSFDKVSKEMNPKLLLADHTWHESMKFNKGTEIYKFLKQNSHPLAKAITKNADLFHKNLYPESRFHDPILASCLLTNFVSFSPEKLIVEKNGFTRRPKKNEKGSDILASKNVNYQKVYKHFFESLKKYLKTS